MRIEYELELLPPPSAPAAPAEAGTAGSAGSPLANNRGVSSTSVWKREQADPKGVTGVSLENKNSEIEPHPDDIPPTRDPVQEKEVKVEPNRDLRGGKRSRSPSEFSEPVNPQPKEEQPMKINSTVGSDLQGHSYSQLGTMHPP